jgi:hypothetical protein
MPPAPKKPILGKGQGFLQPKQLKLAGQRSQFFEKLQAPERQDPLKPSDQSQYRLFVNTLNPKGTKIPFTVPAISVSILKSPLNPLYCDTETTI